MQHPMLSVVSGPMGHVVDRFRAATFSLDYAHSYTKFKVLKELGRRYSAQSFIETGTFLGVTARRAARVFKRVVTIELDEWLAAEATRTLRHCDNVTVLQGDAVALLGKAFSLCQSSPILIFLDAHASGGPTACGEHAEPAIQELELLSQYADRIAAIVIDDFRMFGTEPGVPTKSSLLAACETYFPAPAWSLSVAIDQVIIRRTSVNGAPK
jgi:predicted O-methyltransferase YrrM